MRNIFASFVVQAEVTAIRYACVLDKAMYLSITEFKEKTSKQFLCVFPKTTRLGWVGLNQECEPLVIHRGITTSNIILDASFYPRLGEFGLARLMDHDKRALCQL
ncbi:hypothetical protein RHMOL_Rhmol11G0279200 [Rhododendron molle]|uniref:Uncharacterized protein n=1 Tax=Rhododendron molle TaxID=49168 RepID=A0ACC0LX51_RHOML|nr:hypothetical protein RHMOL_Rhmol11G0279200 [Rhododendron molle]